MKKPGRFMRWWILANILGIGLFFHFWMQKSTPGFPVHFTAKDGTRFIFNDLESKTNIPNEELSFYEEVMGSLPKSLQSEVSVPPTWNIAFDQPALVLSYEMKSSNPEAALRYGFRMLDENEDEMEETGHKLWTTAPKSHDPAHPLVYSDFLRRSKTFKLQILEHSGPTNKVIKEIVFKNGSPFKAAPFPALPLPQRQTNGPLSVVMEDAVWIPNSGSVDERSPAGIRSAGFSVLQFSMAYNGQQTTNWSIIAVFSKTADGRGDGGMHTGLWANGKCYFTIKKAMRPTEPMNYRVMVQQTHWDTNEVWNTPLLPLAQDGKFIALNLSNNFQGQTILVKGVSGRHSSPPWRAFKTREASIDLETSTDLTRLVALEMQDHDGKPLVFNPQYFVSSGQTSTPRNHFAFYSGFSNNVESVTLKIAIRKTLWLNYSVQTRVTTTNDPAFSKRVVKP